MKNFPEIGIQIAEILLPKSTIALEKWPVIACDQFTSEPEYWDEVERIVAGEPSTYQMILPEVFLNTPKETARLQSTQQAMRQYLDEGLLEPCQGFILVERAVEGNVRHGLMLALDLEYYDYNRGSQTLIRATEGTILDRLPPRIRIRQDACIELPHILVLIDDPGYTVIQPLLEHRSKLNKVYDLELMLNGGHLTGYSISEKALEDQIVTALQKLAAPETFYAKYGLSGKEGVLLFAVGDGNHSLATAKAIWEKLKPTVGMDHPARYALVEIENVHDRGLHFEPIHRVLFSVEEDYRMAMRRYYGDSVFFRPVENFAALSRAVTGQHGETQIAGVMTGKVCELVIFERPTSNLPVGTLQPFLDQWVKACCAEKIDYVHGDEAFERLSHQPGNIGFYLPAMPKSDLFKTVILDGVLPRKTFSMGEAREKRYYMECRKIC